MYFTEIKSLTGQNMINSSQKIWVELDNRRKKMLGNKLLQKQVLRYFFVAE